MAARLPLSRPLAPSAPRGETLALSACALDIFPRRDAMSPRAHSAWHCVVLESMSELCMHCTEFVLTSALLCSSAVAWRIALRWVRGIASAMRTRDLTTPIVSNADTERFPCSGREPQERMCARLLPRTNCPVCSSSSRPQHSILHVKVPSLRNRRRTLATLSMTQHCHRRQCQRGVGQ